jgi:hypothetical protein
MIFNESGSPQVPVDNWPQPVEKSQNSSLNTDVFRKAQ